MSGAGEGELAFLDGRQQHDGLDPTLFPIGCHLHIITRNDNGVTGVYEAMDAAYFYLLDRASGDHMAVLRTECKLIVNAASCDGSCFEERSDGEDDDEGGEEGDGGDSKPPQLPLLE